MTKLKFSDSEPVIKQTLRLLKNNSILKYMGVNFFFEGSIRNGKISGYFTPDERITSKSPNHFDPLSGFSLEGKYDLPKGLLSLSVQPGIMFWVTLFFSIGGFSMATYWWMTDPTNSAMYMGAIFGALTILGMFIYYYSTRKLIRKFVTQIYDQAAADSENMDAPNI